VKAPPRRGGTPRVFIFPYASVSPTHMRYYLYSFQNEEILISTIFFGFNEAAEPKSWIGILSPQRNWVNERSKRRVLFGYLSFSCGDERSSVSYISTFNVRRSTPRHAYTCLLSLTSSLPRVSRTHRYRTHHRMVEL
jgi:hypothetical protein